MHSGNYGNWAPNPALQLARLLASMKDDNGRVTIDGFYDDVAPLTAEEKKAIDEIPDVAPELMKTFGFSRPETTDRLELRHNLPTLTDHTMPFTFKAQLPDFSSEFSPVTPGVELLQEPLGRARVISGYLLEDRFGIVPIMTDTRGQMTASVTVSDGRGQSSTATVTVNVQ